MHILTDQFDLVLNVRSNGFQYFNLIHDRNKLLAMSDCSHNQYIWKWETKTINCTGAKIGGSFQCLIIGGSLKACVKMSYYDSYELVLVTGDNDVILLTNNYETVRYKNRNESQTPQEAIISETVVKECVHKVKQIEVVSIVIGRVLICSLLTKSITILHSSSLTPFVKVVVPFECALSYFSLPHKFLLLQLSMPHQS